jgi:hypothetical protein
MVICPFMAFVVSLTGVKLGWGHISSDIIRMIFVAQVLKASLHVKKYIWGINYILSLNFRFVCMGLARLYYEGILDPHPHCMHM